MNSVYTIAIGSASSTGVPAYYDEPCSAKMAVSFVDNPSVPDLQVVFIAGITISVFVFILACVYVCVFVCVCCVSLSLLICLCVCACVCVCVHARLPLIS